MLLSQTLNIKQKLNTKNMKKQKNEKTVIAVDQDPLLKPGTRVEQGVYSDIYAKPLADGSIAVALWNKVNFPLDITLKVSSLKHKLNAYTYTYTYIQHQTYYINEIIFIHIYY